MVPLLVAFIAVASGVVLTGGIAHGTAPAPLPPSASPTAGPRPSSELGLPPDSAGWHSAIPSAPSMDYRLYSVSRISAACTTWNGAPAWMAYDSSDTSVWVADPPACVDRLQPASSGFSWSLTAAIPVGLDPFGLAYDNGTNEVFVANTGSDNVTVISAKTNLTVASIGVGSAPMGVAFDPVTGEVYVANHGSDNVTVIAGGNLTVVANVAVGTGPVGVAVDPASRQAFVANSGSSNVSIIADQNHSLVATVAAGNGPYGVAVDNVSDTVYVSNNLTQNVSVINASSDRLTATVAVPTPAYALEGISFDPATGLVWVGGGYSFAVVINASQNIVIGYAGTDPSDTLYDPANGDVCVTNTGNTTFECLSFNFYGPTDAVNFSATGLPAGSSWGVTVAAAGTSGWAGGPSTTLWSTSAGMTIGGFWNLVGTYNYSVQPPGGYVATPASGTLCFYGVNSTCYPTRINVSLTVATGLYPVTLTEQGLPSGTYWVADVGGSQRASTTSSVAYWLGNGTYNFSVGQTGLYVPTPSNGTLVVNGTGATIAIRFTAPPSYAVTFGESGLPIGTAWYLWLGGATGTSTTTTLALNVTNGTYAFVLSSNGFVVNRTSGNLTVHGAPVWVNVTFLSAPYFVVFSETGLPAGTWWSVDLQGVALSGQTEVGSREPNGTFYFAVTNLTGWVADPATGNVTVAGANVSLTIRFAPGNATWDVAIQETGLAAGTSWSVALGGHSGSSSTSAIVLTLPDGTYPLSVNAIPDYSVTAPSTVVVQDQNLTVGVTFTPSQYGLTFESAGLPNGTGWGVVIGSQLESGLGTNLTFEEPNGTYGYVVLAVPGFVTHFSGTAVVNGSPVRVLVRFSPQTYPIEFVELGLPSGSNWSVTVANASTGFNETESSTSNAIVFFLPNGTYLVTFGLPSGFTGTSSSNLVVVAGQSIAGPSVTASGRSSPPPTPGSGGFLGVVGWELVTIVASCALVGGIAAVWALRRRGGNP